MRSRGAARLAEIAVREEASVDIANTYRFSLENFGEAVAAEYMAGLDEAIGRLGRHPEMGRIDRGIVPPIRILTYRSHRIYYDFDGTTVYIARIFHHAMNAAARLQGRG